MARRKSRSTAPTTSEARRGLGLPHVGDEGLDGPEHFPGATALGHTLEREVGHRLRGKLTGPSRFDPLEDLLGDPRRQQTACPAADGTEGRGRRG